MLQQDKIILRSLTYDDKEALAMLAINKKIFAIKMPHGFVSVLNNLGKNYGMMNTEILIKYVGGDANISTKSSKKCSFLLLPMMIGLNYKS